MTEAKEPEVKGQNTAIHAAKQRADSFFASHQTIPYKFRRQQLDNLEAAIRELTPEIEQALKEDLNKHSFEAFMTEIGMALDEIKYVKKHLRTWMRPKRIFAGATQQPGRLSVNYNPYGTVLVMSPWNYPFLLTMAPIIGAIAAGNTLVVKPSAYAPKTADIIEKVCKQAFPPGLCELVLGGRAENSALMEEDFDYIFFTGSPAVGKLVMQHAAEHLTPLTLELGGKSPCVIDSTAKLQASAKRLAFAKFVNSGQTCVAPDYVLLDHSVRDEFLAYLGQEFRAIAEDKDYFQEYFPAIVNQKHFQRLVKILAESPAQIGGQSYPESRQIEPALVVDPDLDSQLMREEIFGPILPVITVKDWREAADFIGQRPKPLALYLFSNDREAIDYYRDKVSFGGGCVNDALIHLSSPKAPFGGVGNSGIGRYHGKDSFLTFSHQKTLVRKAWFGDLDLRYHPYTKRKNSLIRKLLG